MKKVLLLIVLLLTVMPARAQDDSGTLIVVWADDTTLSYWRSDDPQVRQLIENQSVVPDVAPDGATVAFWATQQVQADLWLVDAATGQLTQVKFESPDHQITPYLAWSIDGQTLYFMTDVGTGLDRRAANDLWKVDIDGGDVQQLLPDGEGGRRLLLSPDGATLAIVAAGQYAQPGEPPGDAGRIMLYDLAAERPVNAMEFEGVASASEWPWYPSVRWLDDSSGILTAIPPADLVYGEIQENTELWVVPINGKPFPSGQVNADFFGLPEFSADGEWIAYLERRDSPEHLPHQLMIAHSDGTDPQPYWQLGERGALFYNWLPEEDRIQLQEFGADGVTSIWVGRPDEAPSLLQEYALAGFIQWVDDSTYVFSTAELDGDQLTGFELSYGGLKLPPQVIARSDSYITFDAVSIP